MLFRRWVVPSICLHAVALQFCSQQSESWCRRAFLNRRFHFPNSHAVGPQRSPLQKLAQQWKLPLARKLRQGVGTRAWVMPSEAACKLRVIFVSDVYELDNWPRFLTAMEAFREHNTIVCLPGDFVAPSLLSTMDFGRAMIDCMNRCKIDFVCFGNHETDIPMEELRSRIVESNFTWINSNMHDLDIGVTLPEYRSIVVHGGGQTRRVALLGLLSADPGLYRPNSFGGATISDVADSADKLQARLYHEDGVDLVLPMTHQSIADDRAFAARFQGVGVDNANAFPLVLGAHDHEEYSEQIGGATIIKTGMDASNVGICDIAWNDPTSKAVEVTARLEPVANFEPNRELQRVVEAHTQIVHDLDSAPLFLCSGEPVFESPLSSRNNRIRQTNLGTKLVSSLRDALASECCVLNAGNLRGDTDYPPDKKFFTYKDLKAEIVFDCEMVTLPLPGKVISDAVSFSRRRSRQDPPEADGGYLQICDNMRYDEATQRVTHIGGAPLEAEREYSCGLLFMLLSGMDANRALMAWKDRHANLIPSDQCPQLGRPAKLLLVDYFSKAIWYQLGGFEALDAGGKGFVSRDDLYEGVARHFGRSAAAVCVDNIMRSADTDRDGRVTPDELLRVHFANAWARRDMDLNRDGRLQREEVAAFARRVLGSRFDAAVVEGIMAELGMAGGDVSHADVQRWVTERFDLRGVSVPGQTLDRREIRAVQESLRPSTEASPKELS